MAAAAISGTAALCHPSGSFEEGLTAGFALSNCPRPYYSAQQLAPARHKYFALRHGESLANVAGIISSDPKISIPRHGLSEKGKGQAQKTGAKLVATLDGPVLIVSSDFKRARETADLLRSRGLT